MPRITAWLLLLALPPVAANALPDVGQANYTDSAATPTTAELLARAADAGLAVPGLAPSALGVDAGPVALADAGPAPITRDVPAMAVDAGMPATAVASSAPPVSNPPPILGIQFAVGAPDGAVLSAIYRPWTMLRLNGGLAWNFFGLGLQAGATFLPFHFGVTPTLSAEVGYYFPSNYLTQLERWTTVAPEVAPLFQHVSYTYLSTQLGVEFGAADTFVFFIRFGIGWVYSSQSGPVLSSSASGGTNYSIQGFTLRAAVPSANLGFVVYIW